MLALPIVVHASSDSNPAQLSQLGVVVEVLVMLSVVHIVTGQGPGSTNR